MQRLFILVVLILISGNFVYARRVEGVVVDSQTGELLVGASIFLKSDPTIGTISRLDGSFILDNLPSNDVTLVCKYISYTTIEKELSASHNTQKIVLDLVSHEQELSDIVVVAGASTDISVRNLERLSLSTINIIGARSIELSPDISAASVLSRMSGVVLDRNSAGEPEYAILRGMDKRYNITLVNGIKISSPNNKQRFVPLNLFPSELLERLEVSKTSTAVMEADATGGAINMVMKDAPSFFSIRANASVGYNDLFFNSSFYSFNHNNLVPVAPYYQYGKDYLASMGDFGNSFNAITTTQPTPNIVSGLSIGGRMLEQKIGYILATNYQTTSKIVHSTFFEDEMIQTSSTTQLKSMKTRNYSEHQEQIGLHAKFDYSINDKHKFDFYNFYLQNNNSQVRKSETINFKLSYFPEEGTLDLTYQTRLRYTEQRIWASMLQGEHAFSKKFSLSWVGIYSEANLKRPDQTYINFDNLRENNVDNFTINGDGSERRWEANTDRDLSAVIHSKYHLNSNSSKILLESGVLFRNKKRDNSFVRYIFKPIDTKQSFDSYDQINWNVYTPKGSVNPLNYEAGENVLATYLQMKVQKSDNEFIVGVRAEYTDQHYFMYFPPVSVSPNGGQQYIEFLPNIHYKRTISEKQNFRASYFRSLNRPGFYEIVPYQVINEDYNEYGNPNLKYATINNFDMRWEFFPSALDQILIGIFYKQINSPIEYAYFSVNHRQSGYGPQNLGNATNFGIEIDFIKYFSWIGFKTNYTYTNSSITTPKVYYARDSDNNITTMTTSQTRSLAGQAAHVGNIALLLKDANKLVDAQIALSYTSDRILIASRFLNSDYYEKGALKIDLSLEKQFGRSGFSIFAKGNNLLNTPLIEFVKTNNPVNDKYPLQDTKSNTTLIRKDYYGRQLLIGIRYKK